MIRAALRTALVTAALLPSLQPALAASQNSANNLDRVIADFEQAAEQARQRDMARLESLLDDRRQLEQAVEQAQARQQAAEQRRETLEQRQQSQQQAIDDINQRRSGDEGEDLQPMVETLRNSVNAIDNDLSGSWLMIGRNASGLPQLEENAIPASSDLSRFSDAMSRLIARSADAERNELPVAGSDGDIAPRPVVRLGGVSAFSGNSLLRLPRADEPLAVAENTPSSAASELAALASGDGHTMVFDPTDGEVLRALAQQPSLRERIAQGGVIGYITLALGALGLLMALAQFIWLLLVGARTRHQLRDLDHLRDDNPLGRVLKRFSGERYHEPEVLEARLDETLLAEQPALERGQAVVRVIAAIAPLMGLLGTVSGMIGTFQAITIFGSGDPQMMAGGISQALVTTVLGLVAAIPLLFANTALTSRSRRLMNLLERHASARLADRLDAQHHEYEKEARRHGSPS
ncbi:MotA/TolQ/ExbB proton channel family protein [Kushneria aurantia]|uniref:MotA/TolQ/ExbB proton channel family protein n=1 Tax=Kushneria aurantia TaxID=504092 RepID=A0ABV6G7E3_9GAMM|nr:MotA/TolQ/ExbB proton channel family protein [Kushneria aurantia]